MFEIESTEETRLKTPLNREGLTGYFEQMSKDGTVETTVEWLVDMALLIQSDVEERLRKVLEPFSLAADKADEFGANQERMGMGTMTENATTGWGVKVKHLRAAREAYNTRS